MNRDPRLDRYLSSLENALKPFPVSDRAEIITEIKSHILTALERDPQTNLDTVLKALGEPETVANRYLIERGLRPTKPPISPIVKWLIVGFLGTVAMLLIFVIIVLSQFSPLITVNEKEEKVTLLGGLIQIDGTKDSVRIGDKEFVGSIGGSHPVDTGQTITVNFGNGKFEVSNSEHGGTDLAWNCRTVKNTEGNIPNANVVDGAVVLDLREQPGVKCDITVPKDARLVIDGNNGYIELEEPNFHATAKLMNGKIDFSPDTTAAYKFEVKAMNGSSDQFTSSNDPKAFEINLNVMNGNVSLEN